MDIFYPVERWLAGFTDVIITINKEDYGIASRTFKGARVNYIPGVGIDRNRFYKASADKQKKRRELCVDEDAFVILSVGELNKNKNHETVIKAAAKLNNSRVCYLICGEGMLDISLKRLIAELGMEKQVKLLGYRSDIGEIGRASDIFALPSYREGLPAALMEAMALGLPVVCSNIRGNRDLIENEKGGYLTSPHDVDGFALNIDKLINSSELGRRMGLYNISESEKYDRAVVEKEMELLYLNCLEGGMDDI